MDGTGGQLFYDRNGAIFMRMGKHILFISAMIPWDGMLIMGCGEPVANSCANLLFLDKDRYQEKGTIAGGVAEDNTIESTWRSGIYLSPARKRVTRIEITFYDDANYQTNGFTIQYRADEEVDSNGDAVWNTFHAIGSSYLTGTNKYFIENIEPEFDVDGKLWQFQIVSDYDFNIVGFQPYVGAEPLTLD